MRCLILIALCVAVASADFYNKNRFYKLLNTYKHPQWYDLTNDEYGYKYPGQYMGDNDVDDIRRANVWRLTHDDLDLNMDIDMFDNTYGMLDNKCDVLCKKYGILDNKCDIMCNSGRFGMWDNTYDMLDTEDVLGRDVFDRDVLRQNILGGNRRDIIGDDLLYGQDQWIGGIGELKEVCDANVKLTSRLYKQCKDDKDDKNIVVSPLSIQLALSALNKGARGNTKRQIGRVIGGRLNTQERRQIMNTLNRQFKGMRFGDSNTLGFNTKINPVTLIAINQRTPAQQWFVQYVRGECGALVKHFNFHRQPQQCRQIINNWISQKTNMKINHIVPRDAITDNTKMVLVNALEMKAQWGKQMLRHVTKEAKFYPLETNKVKIVEVMETVGRFNYYEDELVKIAGIPTTQKEMTFYMIVPKHKDGLVAVEKLHLQDSVQLKKLLDKTDLHVRQVGVQLPKFQIKHKTDVRRTLRKQGVTDAFDPLRADFSGITGVSKTVVDEIEDQFQNVDRLGLGLNNVYDNKYGLLGDNMVGLGDKKIHLNKFIHQATIKVTENGITAATGAEGLYGDLDNLRLRNLDGRFGGLELDETNVFDRFTGMMGGDLMGDKMVKANRAFAFVVKHNPTNQVILVGRVIDAAQKKVHDIYQTINNVDQL